MPNIFIAKSLNSATAKVNIAKIETYFHQFYGCLKISLNLIKENFFFKNKVQLLCNDESENHQNQNVT